MINPIGLKRIYDEPCFGWCLTGERQSPSWWFWFRYPMPYPLQGTHLRIPLSWAEASHKNSRATWHLVTENCSRKVQGLDQIHQTDQTYFQDFPRLSTYQLLGHTSSTAWALRTSCSRSQFPETDEWLCWAQRCERQWGRNDPGKRPQTVRGE